MGIVPGSSLQLPTGIVLTTAAVKMVTWPLIIRPDVHKLVSSAAKERGINPSYLVETALVSWLNANILTEPIRRIVPPKGGKTAYYAGQLAAIDYKMSGIVNFDRYLFDSVHAISDLRNRLKRAGFLTDSIQELYNKMGRTYYQNTLLPPSYHPWIVLGFYNLPFDFLAAEPPTKAPLPPDGTAQLTTDNQTGTIKRRGTTPWNIGIGSDVQSALKFAASQLSYTVTGLVETLLIDFLNRHYLADRSKAVKSVPTAARNAYYYGQLARLELDRTGETSADNWLREPKKQLALMKSQLATDDSFQLAYRQLRLAGTTDNLPSLYWFWFFGGFCQLAIEYLATKRGKIPAGN